MSAVSLSRWSVFIVLLHAFAGGVGGILVYLSREHGIGDVAASQILYSLAYISALFALLAIYAPQAGRAGRLGFAGFVMAFTGVALLVAPAFLWIAVVTGQAWSHTALMYAWGEAPYLLVGAFLTLVGQLLLGIASARSGVFPRWAALVYAASAVVAIPAELPMVGGMFTFLWPVSQILLIAALLGFGLHLARAFRADNRLPAADTLARATR